MPGMSPQALQTTQALRTAFLESMRTQNVSLPELAALAEIFGMEDLTVGEVLQVTQEEAIPQPVVKVRSKRTRASAPHLQPKILEVLRERGPMSPQDLQVALSLSRSSASHHLRRLARKGLLRAEGVTRQRVYMYESAHESAIAV